MNNTGLEEKNEEIPFSHETVLGVMRDMSIALLVISAVYAVMSIFSSTIVILWEGTVTGVLALILIRTRSQIAALLLIVMSLIALLNGIMNLLGVISLGVRNIPLALISLWCAWRCLQAASELKIMARTGEPNRA